MAERVSIRNAAATTDIETRYNDEHAATKFPLPKHQITFMPHPTRRISRRLTRKEIRGFWNMTGRSTCIGRALATCSLTFVANAPGRRWTKRKPRLRRLAFA